ncbi:MAG: hypothetical protein IPN71_14870 [Fibrobacteres bacterium]|nr:hypothetical protein [Fibrobacterota bacterium]
MNPLFLILPTGIALAVFGVSKANNHAQERQKELAAHAGSVDSASAADSTQGTIGGGYALANSELNYVPLEFPNSVGLRTSADWTGIQIGLGTPAIQGQLFVGLEGAVDQVTHQWDSSDLLMRTHTENTTKSTGLRFRAGYEYWAQTRSPVILTVATSLEASRTWATTEVSSDVERKSTTNTDANPSLSEAKRSETEWEATEFGPRFGVGLRIPSAFSCLTLVAKMESGLSWTETAPWNSSDRKEGWRRMEPVWSVGADWSL